MSDEIILVCFNCDKTFKKSEMKQKSIPCSSATMGAISQKMIELDQCPHCGACALFGFNRVRSATQSTLQKTANV